MEISDRMHLIIENGINYRSLESSPYSRFLELGVDSYIINNIRISAETKQDFQIGVEDLKKIIIIFEDRIDVLLMHPDFDPDKEKLRAKYKVQYESYPFEWKGKLYYLYPKTSNFPIDNKISSVRGFMNTMKAHVQDDSPLKYNFRDNRPS
ncbi:MAG: hypothetical protein ACI9Y7_001668 [Dokdonia sp.]|jgi:hypothetical protein